MIPNKAGRANKNKHTYRGLCEKNGQIQKKRAAPGATAAAKKVAKEAKGGGLPRLDPYLTRCLVFATRLQPSDGSAATADAGALDAGVGGGGGASARKVLAKRLLRALKTTAGLGPASKLGLCSKAHVKRRLRKAIARDGRLRWRKVFRPPSEEEEEAASLRRLTRLHPPPPPHRARCL